MFSMFLFLVPFSHFMYFFVSFLVSDLRKRWGKLTDLMYDVFVCEHVFVALKSLFPFMVFGCISSLSDVSWKPVFSVKWIDLAARFCGSKYFRCAYARNTCFVDLVSIFSLGSWSFKVRVWRLIGDLITFAGGVCAFSSIRSCFRLYVLLPRIYS